mmetsp:Transcript_13019/g.25508  ORF Transcript_13019/g.25508 Transcript_13019/m.25508 type:complete len:121 (+) Transcript_13019:26-388(+)
MSTSFMGWGDGGDRRRKEKGGIDQSLLAVLLGHACLLTDLYDVNESSELAEPGRKKFFFLVVSGLASGTLGRFCCRFDFSFELISLLFVRRNVGENYEWCPTWRAFKKQETDRMTGHAMC